jgi:transcriptional regulator with XRE-family HTH domain
VLEPRPPSVSEPLPGQPGTDLAEELARDVARAVRDLRLAAGLSERAAARALGTSQTQLRRMEDPRYLPSLRSLARVAAVYGQHVRIGFEPGGTAAPARERAKPAPPAKEERPRPRPPAKRTRAARGRRR